jgi:hypothetical protein
MSMLDDRLSDESDSAYGRFLAYCALPIGIRSVDAAYRTLGGNSNKRRAPGCWYREARERRWHMRAAARDLEAFDASCEQGVTAFLAALALAATKVRDRLQQLEPSDWRECLDALRVISEFVPDQAIVRIADGIQQRAKGGTEPMRKVGTS